MVRRLALVSTILGCAAGCGASASPAARAETDAGASTPVDASSPVDAGTPADASSSADAGASDVAAPVDAPASADTSPPVTDVDQDGLDDTKEAEWASAYFPYLSISPADGCKTHGILVRVSPHPQEKTRIMLWYDVLYNADCGANGHTGDDEMFGVVVDPARPAPDGILAVRGISHQGTPCQQITTCGQCTGMTACATATRNGKAYPTVFPSVNKHGNYADQATCMASFICDFGGCSLSPSADAPPFVNAGEPLHPMVHDLTTEGFVTTANGWTNTVLLHFDPWKAGNFGGAGDVSKDLVDPSFVVDTTACP